MGLFSKLFSREGEEPTESEGQDAQAAPPDGEDSVKKSDESAAGAGSPKDPRARVGAEAPQPTAASDKHGEKNAEKNLKMRTEAGMGGQQPVPAGKRAAPPLEASSEAAKGAKKQEPAKREALPAKPPALGAAAAQRAPQPAAAAAAVAPPAPAGEASSDSTQRAQAAAAAARRGIAPMRGPRETLQTHGIGAPAAGGLGRELHPGGANDNAALHLDDAVDAAMAAIIDSSQQPGVASEHHDAADQRAVAETFADMAKVHAHPLRELMFQLSVGSTSRQWAAACRPVLKPLFDGATQIGLLELVGALGAFDAALERAAAEPSAFVGDAASEALRAAYERLRQQLPDAFTPPVGADTRRMILLESLLLQIPELHRRTLAKLYAAGLSTLSQLASARPEEIAVVAGIDRALAQTVVDHVRRFEQERSKFDPAAMRTHLQERLRALVGRLSQLQNEFESAEAEESAARKRTARRDREAAVLELDLLFAEAGEIDVIEELKRCPVRGKIERVESYLERLQASA